jgi:hypothetical protein
MRRRGGLLLGLLAVAAMAAVLIFVVFSRLSSSPRTGAESGPLGPPGNPATQCLPGRPGHANTQGVQNFTNTSHDTLVIDRVTLGAPHNIRLTGVFLVPGRWLVGTWATFPPPANKLLRGVQWSKRRQPAGTRVLPGHWINVVVGLEPTSRPAGSTSGIEIFYHDGRAHYELRSRVRTIIRLPPSRCS